VHTLLVTLSGPDRPGITRTLFTVLSRFDVHIRDMEQLVVHDRLVLAVLIELTDEVNEDRVTQELQSIAAQLSMEVDIAPGNPKEIGNRRNRMHVTALGQPLTPQAIAHISGVMAEHGANIDRIRRIASYPVTALVFEGSGADIAELRRALTQIAAEHHIDIAVQGFGLDRRGQHLVLLDVDSTLIQDEVIDLLAEHAGVGAQVSAITERAMNGELDFQQALRERVALLRGLPVSVFDDVREQITLTPGARTLCRTLLGMGYPVCLVSGGFTEIIEPIARELGVSGLRANQLGVENGRLTGEVRGPIVDRDEKRRALEEFAMEFGIPMRRTIAIGDGANDIDMLQAAGLGVAFNAKSAARAAADASVTFPYLDSVLYLLGITREDIEGADALAGVTTPAPPLTGNDDVR
jgi:phosphoserine phosphatase